VPSSLLESCNGSKEDSDHKGEVSKGERDGWLRGDTLSRPAQVEKPVSYYGTETGGSNQKNAEGPSQEKILNRGKKGTATAMHRKFNNIRRDEK